MIHCIEYQVFDCFLGVLSAAWAQRMDYQFLQEPGPQKVFKNSYIPSNTYYIPFAMQWGGPVVAYYSLQLAGVEDALPPGTEEA
jgi:hypothetical protein